MRAAPPEQDHGYDTALDDPRTDAEALCLCSLLWSSPAVARTIVAALTGSDFERPVYGELFTVIAEQVQTNTPHDPASIAAALTQAGKAPDTGELTSPTSGSRSSRSPTPKTPSRTP